MGNNVGKPIFILAGQSNANKNPGIQDEIRAALDNRFGVDQYELVVAVRGGSPLTYERNIADRPDDLNYDRFLALLRKIEYEVPMPGNAASKTFADLSQVNIVISELGNSARAASDESNYFYVHRADIIHEQQRLAADYSNIVTVDPDIVAHKAGLTGEAYDDEVHYAGNDGTSDPCTAPNFKAFLAEALVEQVTATTPVQDDFVPSVYRQLHLCIVKWGDCVRMHPLFTKLLANQRNHTTFGRMLWAGV